MGKYWNEEIECMAHEDMKAPERKTCQAGQARLGQCAILQEAYGRKGRNA